MARYRACMHGDHKKEVSRLGRKYITADINGWDVGVRVLLQPDDDDKNIDRVQVFLTGGSNDYTNKLLICDIGTKHLKSDLK